MHFLFIIKKLRYKNVNRFRYKEIADDLGIKEAVNGSDIKTQNDVGIKIVDVSDYLKKIQTVCVFSFL